MLRRDLPEILSFSRSLPLHTSIITNGTLLEDKIGEIAPYVNGVVYVSLDGLEKTHDTIRGVNGCFKKVVQGITAAKQKVPITINTTVMAENVDEIESMVEFAKEMGIKISIAAAHEYCNANTSAIAATGLTKVACRLIELKRKGYPIVNSIGYFKVLAEKKHWHCKPWTMINIDPEGKLILPCYVHNDYASSISICGESGIRSAVVDFDWRKIASCQKCRLHCYVEPSLVLSKDISAYMHWAFRFDM